MGVTLQPLPLMNQFSKDDFHIIKFNDEIPKRSYLIYKKIKKRVSNSNGKML